MFLVKVATPVLVLVQSYNVVTLHLMAVCVHGSLKTVTDLVDYFCLRAGSGSGNKFCSWIHV